ncbi:SMC-Scp complex subunit ScpB [Nioella sp.]|uniref:SMC-Scp complex subunit ScpB n=1 Tax=Nioella sp. TaxID=1912091 RepID=UPI0035130AD0
MSSDDIDDDATERLEEAAAQEESLFQAPPLAEQERMVEAMLFASSEPLSTRAMQDRMPHGCDAAEAVFSLRKRYEGRGVNVVRVGDAWAIRTAPDLSFLMSREQVETRKLSRAAIETLAIVAYHQPCTRAEIEEIRGVSVSRGTIDQLMEMEWLRFGRRKMTPGRPVTYVVTQGFLDHFGLETTRDLPGLKELRAAGLLDSRPPPGSFPGPEDAGEDDAMDPPEDQEDMFGP